MSLVPAICPQCGGAIEVDDTHEAGICKYCNTPFITEKVIQNYNINIQNAVINVSGAKVENIKKLGDEKLKSSHYPFEMDEYVKAQEYFAKVLEYEDNKEYKLKHDLCDRANHPDRISGYDVPTVVGSVIDFINEDKSTESPTNDRITVYADLVRVMIDAVEAVTGYYYNRFSSGSLNSSAYVSMLSNLVRRKLDCAYILLEYKDNPQINEVAIQLCKTCEGDLASYLPVYVPNMSAETYDEMQMLAKNIQSTGSRFSSSYEVREDILNASASNRTQNNKTASSGGCYIATAVYGSYDCPQVWTLRRYRDNTLSKTWYGRAFIHTYYAISPTLVKWFGDTDWFKNMWKPKLDKTVLKLNKRGFSQEPYNDKY